MAGVCAHRGDAERVAGEAGRVGDAGQDVEVAPAVVGGAGKSGGTEGAVSGTAPINGC